MTNRLTLSHIAHARSGDKGNHANIAVLAYTPQGFDWLRANLTAEMVADYFRPLKPTRVERYEAANVLGLNFVLYDVLAGGASRSLRSDSQGKTLGLALLRLELDLSVADALPMRRSAAIMSDLVQVEYYGRTAILTLNRPARRNALSRALIAALSEAFEQAEANAEVRAVVLTGAGSVFCAGMDLAELQESQQNNADEAAIRDDALKLARLYDRIYRLSKPTVAAVNGPALAGGAGLVSVCDLAVAVPEATFGYPEVRRGLVAAMVMPHLLRLVGERAARFLLLTGELIDAQEACRVGLINTVVAGEQLRSQALRWAGSLAEGGPEALRATKQLLTRLGESALSVEETAEASAAPRLGEECRQGLQAFFERRPAPWLTERV